MRAFTDTTTAINEPKTARMEQRTKPHVKATIQQAAALLGVDETTFIASVAYERARAAIADHQSTLLSAADSAMFLAALDAPPATSEALKAAVRLHASAVGNDA